MKGVHFDKETDDHPSETPAWGLAGWTKGDKSVLLYDRFDIWEFDPTGVKPRRSMVTDSVGAQEQRSSSVSRSPAAVAVGAAAAVDAAARRRAATIAA